MKIEAKDLRIGNWVQYQSSLGIQPTRVNSINETGIDLFVNDYHPHDIRADLEYNDITAIPLTHEILEKAGCSQYDLGYYNLTDDTIISIDNHVYFVINDNSKHWLAECTYLHQIQNLYYCLTSQELNIEL